jgi:hypothetical protein
MTGAPARSSLGVLAVLLAGVAGVAVTQPRLAKTAHTLKERDDLIAFPPPAEMHVAVLGWDAAAVDILWADLLVQYGLHFSEHRDFTEIPRYLDAILALEPSYAPLYRYVDTLLSYRPMQGTENDVRLARAYLERGTRERPDDTRLWLQYGGFLAFVGPSFLKLPEERDVWRREGAVAMGHAVEIGADADEALAAASLLKDAGSAKEALKYLEHAYVFTEHPMMHDIHERIGRRLAELEANVALQAADAAARTIEERRAAEAAFVPHDLYLVLGPRPDTARCSGRIGANALDDAAPCARSWAELIPDPE